MSNESISWYIHGPWKKQYNKHGQYEIIDSRDQEVLIIEAYASDAAHDEANLISAAPEMLILLKKLIDKSILPPDLQTEIKQVIAKAND
jgi:hypothetical protein